MASIEAHIFTDRMDKDVRVYLSDVSRDFALDCGIKVKTEVQRLIRERALTGDVASSGGLADSIIGDLFPEPGDAWGVHVFSETKPDVALWFEEGTGLFGPRHTYITATNSPFMSFRPRGSNRYVRAIRVAGYPGRHPFRDGLEAAKPKFV